jgi:hypothetical protein
VKAVCTSQSEGPRVVAFECIRQILKKKNRFHTQTVTTRHINFFTRQVTYIIQQRRRVIERKKSLQKSKMEALSSPMTKTASVYSLRRTSSLPKNMHLIYSESSLPTSGLSSSSSSSSSSSVDTDPSHFIRRVLSDLREADSSPIGKSSPISVRTSPGHFMRGLLSDLQQVDTASSTGRTPRSPQSISQQMNARHFARGVFSNLQESDSSPTGKDNSSSFGWPYLVSPLKQKGLHKNKDFSVSSVSSAKRSMASGATATTTTMTNISGATSYSSHSLGDNDEIIRFASNSTVTENKSDENTDHEASSLMDGIMDDSTLTILRRKRNRSWNLYIDNVEEGEGMSKIGKAPKGNARKTTSSSLFARERTKSKGFFKNRNCDKTETILMSAMATAFPSYHEDNSGSIPWTLSMPQIAVTTRQLTTKNVDWNENIRFPIPTNSSILCNELKKIREHQKIDMESKCDSDDMESGDVQHHHIDFEYQKKKPGKGLFSRKPVNCSKKRNVRVGESNPRNSNDKLQYSFQGTFF